MSNWTPEYDAKIYIRMSTGQMKFPKKVGLRFLEELFRRWKERHDA